MKKLPSYIRGIISQTNIKIFIFHNQDSMVHVSRMFFFGSVAHLPEFSKLTNIAGWKMGQLKMYFLLKMVDLSIAKFTKRVHPGRLTAGTWEYTTGKGNHLPKISKASFSGSMLIFRGCTPWKINGWNIQITHLERKMISQTSMRTCSMLIFQGCSRWVTFVIPGRSTSPARPKVWLPWGNVFSVASPGALNRHH